MDGRLENTSKALRSSLALGVPHVCNKRNLTLPPLSVDRFLPCLNHVVVL